MVAIRCSLIRQFDVGFWRSGINPKTLYSRFRNYLYTRIVVWFCEGRPVSRRHKKPTAQCYKDVNLLAKSTIIQNRRGTETSPYSKIRWITNGPHKILRNLSVHGSWDFHHTSGNRNFGGVLVC